MPPDLYSAGSSYHRQRRWTHPHSLRCLDTAIRVIGKPASLLDVGCGEGVHVAWSRVHGIDAMGIDLAVPENDPAFVYADLCQPVDLRRQFAWVLCWEVAEHLPASAADTLCDTLVRHLHHSGRLIFTAAGPRQRGPGHIHCVERRFWQQRFAERGLTYAADLSAALKRAWLTCSPKTPWYGKNCQVFWRVA